VAGAFFWPAPVGTTRSTRVVAPRSPAMLERIPSATLHGVDGRPVSVEVHVSAGLPGFTVVGLPDAAVLAPLDRVRAALLSSQLSWPSRRVTVNLAPSRSQIGKSADGQRVARRRDRGRGRLEPSYYGSIVKSCPVEDPRPNSPSPSMPTSTGR
jgi:hypothetical protein